MNVIDRCWRLNPEWMRHQSQLATFSIANNFYQGWVQYAIGGSMEPSLKSEANLFIAPKTRNKEVEPGSPTPYCFEVGAVAAAPATIAIDVAAAARLNQPLRLHIACIEELLCISIYGWLAMQTE
ncbi:hypothetical protein Fmac_021119 [Flemingia macrophylla]|uniref:Uncharacterized protein n=1 Tax=Flemingia macrophylla TaxID=520843 RepID=A0ABD1LW72_9FABA